MVKSTLSTRRLHTPHPDILRMCQSQRDTEATALLVLSTFVALVGGFTMFFVIGVLGTMALLAQTIRRLLSCLISLGRRDGGHGPSTGGR